jgi:hypothetical protein
MRNEKVAAEVVPSPVRRHQAFDFEAEPVACLLGGRDLVNEEPGMGRGGLHHPAPVLPDGTLSGQAVRHDRRIERRDIPTPVIEYRIEAATLVEGYLAIVDKDSRGAVRSCVFPPQKGSYVRNGRQPAAEPPAKHEGHVLTVRRDIAPLRIAKPLVPSSGPDLAGVRVPTKEVPPPARLPADDEHDRSLARRQ